MAVSHFESHSINSPRSEMQTMVGDISENLQFADPEDELSYLSTDEESTVAYREDHLELNTLTEIPWQP